MYLEFNGSCLKTTEKYFFYPVMIELNKCIVYELSSNLNNFDPAIENCLFGAARLTKNADIVKYKYTGYGIGFDSKGTFLFPDGNFGQNVIMFGADMSSSAHANNKTRNIVVLGKDFIQGIDGTTSYAEKIIKLTLLKAKQYFV